MKTRRVTIIVVVNGKAFLMNDSFIVLIFIIDTSLVLFVVFHYNMVCPNDIHFISFKYNYLSHYFALVIDTGNLVL